MSTRDPSGDPEDLGARARRGLLTRAEQRELARATDASATLRVAYQVGCDMDSVTAVRGGDDALIARAASAALARVTNGSAASHAADERHAPEVARVRGRRVPARVISAAAIALCVLSASGMAAALWSGMVRWPFAAAERAAPVPAPVRPHARRARFAAPAVPPAVVAPAAPAAGASEESVRAPAARARRSGPAELFHGANAARRSGDFARAVRLYAELRSAYPDSDEGGLARVSLGQLLLARGDAAAAESEFRRYLARGAGQLAPEALVGQAQSLRRLGRARAERDSLRRLLADYPNSVYAAQARQRLAVLEGGATNSAR